MFIICIGASQCSRMGRGGQNEGQCKIYYKYISRQESTELTLGAVRMVQWVQCSVFNKLESAAAALVLLRSDCPVAVALVRDCNTQVSLGISRASDHPATRGAAIYAGDVLPREPV